MGEGGVRPGGAPLKIFVRSLSLPIQFCLARLLVRDYFFSVALCLVPSGEVWRVSDEREQGDIDRPTGARPGEQGDCERDCCVYFLCGHEREAWRGNANGVAQRGGLWENRGGVLAVSSQGLAGVS